MACETINQAAHDSVHDRRSDRADKIGYCPIERVCVLRRALRNATDALDEDAIGIVRTGSV
jgi:hypothetical protein